MTKEHPILFNSEMVRAILDGRKTMTRRVIKEPFEIHANGDLTRPEGNDRLCPYPCPYGSPGDRLWVRETWKPDNTFKGGGIPRLGIKFGDAVQWKEGSPDQNGPWKPSIFMPRWACRITLKVTDVKVHRVQDISSLDVCAEGIEWQNNGPKTVVKFSRLWDSINEKRGFGWDKNPWVWVVEFKRINNDAKV